MTQWTNPSTGQWFVSTEGIRWWFDSGSIALDFAYTGSMGDNSAWEQWHEPGDLARWLTERFGVALAPNAADLRHAKALRHAIAALVDDASAGRSLRSDHVATLDGHAGRPDISPRLGQQIAPTLDEVLSTVAREAVVLLRDHADRVRECSAGDCQVIYVDTSRSANRTWCSMKRCGNRNKVRRQRARQRQATGDTNRGGSVS